MRRSNLAMAALAAASMLFVFAVPAAAAKALSTRGPMMGIQKAGPNVQSGPAMGIPKAGSSAHAGPKPRHMGEKAATTGTYTSQGCGRKPSRGCRNPGH